MESSSAVNLSMTSASSGRGATNSGSNNKSRREVFEEQLRDLQRDISSLSTKLSVPAMVTTNRFQQRSTGSPSASNSSFQDQSSMHIHSRIDSSILSATPIHQQHKDVANINGQSLLNANTPQVVTASDLLYSQHKYDHLDHALRDALRAKDQAQRQLELAEKEIEELRKGVTEYAKLKASYDSLRQDNEAMKVSLQSSERIRLQQKELIAVLQKSQQMLSSSNSVLTFGTNISSIEMGSTIPGTGGKDSDSAFSSLLPPSVQSFPNHIKVPNHVMAVTNNNDHRQWLNTAAQPQPIPSVVHIPRTSGTPSPNNKTPSKQSAANNKGRSQSSSGRPPRAQPSSTSSRSSSAKRSSTTTPSKATVPSSAVKGRAIINTFSPAPAPTMSPSINYAMDGPSQSSSVVYHNPEQSDGYRQVSSLSNNMHRPSVNESLLPTTSSRLDDIRAAPSHNYHHVENSDSVRSPYYGAFSPAMSSTAAVDGTHTQPTISSVSAATATMQASTSNLLTSLLLNQDFLNNKQHVSFTQDTVSPKKRPVSRKKMTKKAAPSSTSFVTRSSASAPAKRSSTTHITPSKSRPITAPSMTSRSTPSKRTSSVGDGNIRILYRPVPSPVSSFSKAKRV